MVRVAALRQLDRGADASHRLRQVPQAEPRSQAVAGVRRGQDQPRAGRPAPSHGQRQRGARLRTGLGRRGRRGRRRVVFAVLVSLAVVRHRRGGSGGRPAPTDRRRRSPAQPGRDECHADGTVRRRVSGQ